MPIKTIFARFLLLLTLPGLVIATQAAGNEAVTASNSVIGAHMADYLGAYGAVQLPTGNIVISSPEWNEGRGAVTCLTPTEYQNGSITVTASNSLTGVSSGDRVGEYGITVLTNGNYVVQTPFWDNGVESDVGAVTWVNGTTCNPHNETTRGVIISATNSLIGSTSGDQVGEVKALTNGHYVVSSPTWNNGAVSDAGAATWANGSTGLSGTVSSANSLVGSTTEDYAGSPIVALANGNYVVVSSFWANPTDPENIASAAGAVTLVNGTTGLTGPIGETNSLLGTHSNDRLGSGGVTELTNGNYVVASYNWTNGAGAVTWVNGTTGMLQNVDSSNSLIGGAITHQVGRGGITALTNGHYVINSYHWDNGGTANVGAITWMDGTLPTSGVLSAANSLVGGNAGDRIGFNGNLKGVIALTNGNYVVASSDWKSAGVTNTGWGAVTWGNGTTGTTGVVSLSNSLVGSRTGDRVGSDPMTVLSNGNYVVSSPFWNGWNNGVIANVGAVTWGDGAAGTVGEVTTINSLVGSKAADKVGSNGVTALTSGNYVVSSPYWDNGATVDVGAVTWVNGTAGISGAVSSANSLVGSAANDRVGGPGIGRASVMALTNGNYVVQSPLWNNGAFLDAGAATWVNGTVGLTGTISASNSLLGNISDSQVSSGGVAALANGQYAVASPWWNGIGAVTWGGSGAAGLTGLVSTGNSLTGSSSGDAIGSSITALANGNYVVVSPYWDNGFTADVGAVTYVNPSGDEPDPDPTLTVELSAATGSGNEGSSGDATPITSITLLVSGGISTTSRAVNLVLTNGTATLGSDYTQTSISIMIPAGTYTTATAVNIPVTALGIIGDIAQEPNETLTLTLQTPSALLTIGDANGNSTTVSSAVYTITSDDIPGATITIADVSVTEGNTGTTTMTFTATLSGSVFGGFIVTTGITNGTATAADGDYAFEPLVLLFAGTNGETHMFTVTINGDTKSETDEKFVVSLNTPSSGAVNILDTAEGTILNDDAPPTGTVTIADVTAAEGSSGTTTMTFTATLTTTAPTSGFTVNTAIAHGTTDASDYAFTPSTLTFAGSNGETQTFTVTINGDTVVEPNETFTVSLNTVSAPTVIIIDTAIGTITNDDTATVTIADVSAAEGNTPSSMTFTATLAGDVAGGFTVNVGIANGTATSGSDYTFSLPTLIFAGTNGETQTFIVSINGDTIVEPNETFTVSLNTVSNSSVTISDTAIGTIINDDAATVTIADVSLNEGNTGTSTMTFTAVLAGTVTGGFTVNTGIAPGTATAGSEYAFTPSPLSFAGTHGETKTFTVTIVGDFDVEPDETFTVSLNTPSKPSIIVTDTATGTVVNDDTAALTIEDVTAAEGNTGTSTITFTATLTGTVIGGFTVNTGIANGTASSINDYTFTPSTLTFAGDNGETQTFTVTINGDTQVEPNETFIVSLNTSSNASVALNDAAIGTIINDDTATLTIADVSLTEGNTGTSIMTFTASLAGSVVGGFTVNTAIADGSALSGSDYTFPPATLTFDGNNGETKTFTVTINGDTLVEGLETFTVSLTTPSNASVIVTDTAIGTITNDDIATATLTIADVSLTEGSAGPSTMTFTATLTGAISGFTVNTGIADGTATSGSDYVFSPSTLTFAGSNGETQTFTVTINGDTQVEADETFTVSLNTVSNTSIAISDTATGTITNDDVLTPFFTWAALPAIANTTLTYELEVATATTFAQASIVGTATTTQPSLVNLNPQPLSDGIKYWRVRGKYTVTATGAVFYSPYSVINSFTIDTIAPPVPALTEPIATALITNTRVPVFKWGLSTGAVRYRLEIDTNNNFSAVELSFSPAVSPFALPNANALSNGSYAWRVVAIDAAGNETQSTPRTFTIALP